MAEQSRQNNESLIKQINEKLDRNKEETNENLKKQKEDLKQINEKFESIKEDNRQTNEKIDSIKEDNRQTNEKIDGMKEEVSENSRVQNEKMSENLIKQMEERFDQNRDCLLYTSRCV